MQVQELMSRNVQLATPDESLRAVAERMADCDIGYMPVGENDRLIGAVTDRDIAIRGVGAGRDGSAKVAEVMTRDVKYCYEDEDVEHVVQNMGDIQLRRIPVMNRQERLVGVLSLADSALGYSPDSTGTAMTGVVVPGGAHNQTRAGHGSAGNGGGGR
ncbi:CBS domain-containing protein [Tistrella mobilis]